MQSWPTPLPDSDSESNWKLKSAWLSSSSDVMRLMLPTCSAKDSSVFNLNAHSLISPATYFMFDQLSVGVKSAILSRLNC